MNLFLADCVVERFKGRCRVYNFVNLHLRFWPKPHQVVGKVPSVKTPTSRPNVQACPVFLDFGNATPGPNV